MSNASGLCPECARFLMVIPEDLGDVWTWTCHNCYTTFVTEKFNYAPDKSDDTDRGSDEPAR